MKKQLNPDTAEKISDNILKFYPYNATRYMYRNEYLKLETQDPSKENFLKSTWDLFNRQKKSDFYATKQELSGILGDLNKIDTDYHYFYDAEGKIDTIKYALKRVKDCIQGEIDQFEAVEVSAPTTAAQQSVRPQQAQPTYAAPAQQEEVLDVSPESLSGLSSLELLKTISAYYKHQGVYHALCANIDNNPKRLSTKDLCEEVEQRVI